MARTLQVYPKAFLAGSTWTMVIKVDEPATGSHFPFEHSIPAGVTVTGDSLLLLKLVFGLVVADSDTDSDVDAALFVDLAQGGPTNGETLWETWQELAESILSGLPATVEQREFWAEWSQQDTARVRNAARRLLINGRGWTITRVHQHEGDGSVLEE